VVTPAQAAAPARAKNLTDHAQQLISSLAIQAE
jgi:hypothetical protein